MTDTEIIKALECKTKAHCDVCDTKEVVPCEWCIFRYIKHSLDLINRQKAEIERLQKENDVIKTNCESMCMSMPNIAKAERAEAIKDFAERLKKKAIHPYLELSVQAVFLEDIDSLVKEMIEE